MQDLYAVHAAFAVPPGTASQWVQRPLCSDSGCSDCGCSRSGLRGFSVLRFKLVLVMIRCKHRLLPWRLA